MDKKPAGIWIKALDSAKPKKAKFKAGDRVERLCTGPGICAGSRATVKRITCSDLIELEGYTNLYFPEHFKRVEHETIVITTDGDIGKAKIIKGGKVVREVKLVRQKGDKHDLKTLAAYAVQKLIPNDGNMIITVKAGYTGAVAVINSKNPAFTDGKILEFVSGKCTTAMFPYAKEFNTLEDVKRCFKKSPYNFDVVELHRR